MITLTRKFKKVEDTHGQTTKRASIRDKLQGFSVVKILTNKSSIRDKLLIKEVQEMEENLPSTVRCNFSDPNNLSEFTLVVEPEEYLWKDGAYKFLVSVGEDYNMIPPVVKCLTKILHPNISDDGDVCLSLLRLNSIDGMGWLPTRRLKDVVFGINSLFTDLCDFSDPLNIEIAEEYSMDCEKVKQRIREYVIQYAMMR